MEWARESDAMPGPAGSIGPVVTNARVRAQRDNGAWVAQSRWRYHCPRLRRHPVTCVGTGEPVDSAAATGIAGARPARPTGSAHPMDLAQAYFDIARAHFELGTYAGYVVAAQAATLAHQIATYSSVARVYEHPALPDGASERGLRPLGRALRRATRRLWERLPLSASCWAGFLPVFCSASLESAVSASQHHRDTNIPI